MNFNPSYLPDKMPYFYKECTQAWCKLHNHIPNTKDDVLNEIIWNNQYLLINKQSFYNKKLKETGFVKLGDILSSDFKLNSWDFLRKKTLSLSDYFLLLGIFSSIPSNWKRLLNDDNQLRRTNPDNSLPDLTTMNTKSVYSALVKRIQTPPTSQGKFDTLYNI